MNINKRELITDIKRIGNTKVTNEELEEIADRVKDLLYIEYNYNLEDIIKEVLFESQDKVKKFLMNEKEE